MAPTVTPPTASDPIPTDSTSVEVGFDFSQGTILLEVDLSGGHIVKLALDTGDEASVLDLEVAKAMNLPFDKLPDKIFNIQPGKGPDLSVPQIAVTKVKVGGGEFHSKNFLVLPIAESLKTMGVDSQGTLGYRFFQEQVIQIDYPASKLRVLPEMPPKPEGAVVLPMQWKQYLKDGPYLITTDQFHVGDHALVAQFDTLFARSMILFTTKVPWLESERIKELPPFFYEEGILRPVQPAGTVALGDHRYEPTPPAYLADKEARVPETDITAVLGNVFFLNAVVTLDYKKDRMMVEWK